MRVNLLPETMLLYRLLVYPSYASAVHIRIEVPGMVKVTYV